MAWKQLTIRHASSELRRRLKARARDEGKSVNAVVVELLEASVGLSDRREALQKYTTWSERDARSFEARLSSMRTVDDALWR